MFASNILSLSWRDVNLNPNALSVRYLSSHIQTNTKESRAVAGLFHTPLLTPLHLKFGDVPLAVEVALA